jgi:hypothetical protein
MISFAALATSAQKDRCESNELVSHFFKDLVQNQ